jgi:uncharacterized membrane protein
MGAFLSLLASASWGTGDFLGGTLSRRANPIKVMVGAQGIALVALVLIAIVAGDFRLGGGYLPWGILGGVSGVIGLSSFYTALSKGAMGTVAPVAACGVVVPVAASLARGESPSVAQILGIVVAAVGVILVTGPERGGSRDVFVLGLAAVAALGFGGALTFIAIGVKHNVVMTLAAMRFTNVMLAGPVVLVALRRTPSPGRADLPALAVIAATDSGANALYAFAVRQSLVSVSSVLASLYPAVTVLLAWRCHDEGMRKLQVAGLVTTLAGVALIAAG